MGHFNRIHIITGMAVIEFNPCGLLSFPIQIEQTNNRGKNKTDQKDFEALILLFNTKDGKEKGNQEIHCNYNN